MMVAGGGHVQLEGGGVAWAARAVPLPSVGAAAAPLKAGQQPSSAAAAARRAAGGDWSQDGSAGSGLSSTWAMHVAPRSSHSGAQQSGSDSTHSHRPGSGENGAAIPSAAELESSIVDILRAGGAPAQLGAAVGSGAATGTASPGLAASSQQWGSAAASEPWLQQQQAAQMQVQAQVAAPVAPRWDGFMTGGPSSPGCWSWQARRPPGCYSPLTTPVAPVRSSDGVAVPASSAQWRWGRERPSGPVAEGLEDLQVPQGAPDALPAWASWRAGPQRPPGAGTAATFAQMQTAGYGGSLSWPTDGGGAAAWPGHGGAPSDASGSRPARTGPWGSLSPRAPSSVTTGAIRAGGLTQEDRLTAIRGLSTPSTGDPQAMHAHNRQSAQMTSAFGSSTGMFSAAAAAASPRMRDARAGGAPQMLAIGSSPGGAARGGAVLGRSGDAGAQLAAQHAKQGSSGQPLRRSDDGSGGGTPGGASPGAHRVPWPGSTPSGLLGMAHRAEQSQRSRAEGHAAAGQQGNAQWQMLAARGVSLGSQWDALMADNRLAAAARSSGGIGINHGGQQASGAALDMVMSSQGRMSGSQATAMAGAGMHAMAFAGAREGSAGMSGGWGSQLGASACGSAGQAEGVRSSPFVEQRPHDGDLYNRGGSPQQRGGGPGVSDAPKSSPPPAAVWPYEPAFAPGAEQSGGQQQMPPRDTSGSQGLFGSAADAIMRDPRHRSPTSTPREHGAWGARSPMGRDGSSGMSHSGHTYGSGADGGAPAPAGPTRVGSVMSGRALPMPPAGMSGSDDRRRRSEPAAADGGAASMKREHTTRGLGEWQPAGKQAKQQGTEQHAAATGGGAAAAAASPAAMPWPHEIATNDIARSLQRRAMMAALQALQRSGPTAADSFSSPGVASTLRSFTSEHASRGQPADDMWKSTSHQPAASVAHSMSSPQQSMLQHSMSMPQQSTSMPQHSMSMPQHGMSSPQHSMSMPQHGMSSPQHGMSSPQHNHTHGRWSPRDVSPSPQRQQWPASSPPPVRQAAHASPGAGGGMRSGDASPPVGSPGAAQFAASQQQQAMPTAARPVRPVPMFRETHGGHADMAQLQRHHASPRAGGADNRDMPRMQAGTRAQEDAPTDPPNTVRCSPPLRQLHARTPAVFLSCQWSMHAATLLVGAGRRARDAARRRHHTRAPQTPCTSVAAAGSCPQTWPRSGWRRVSSRDASARHMPCHVWTQWCRRQTATVGDVGAGRSESGWTGARKLPAAHGAHEPAAADDVAIPRWLRWRRGRGPRVPDVAHGGCALTSRRSGTVELQ